jgi:hypothetical protein
VTLRDEFEDALGDLAQRDPRAAGRLVARAGGAVLLAPSALAVASELRRRARRGTSSNTGVGASVTDDDDSDSGDDVEAFDGLGGLDSLDASDGLDHIDAAFDAAFDSGFRDGNGKRQRRRLSERASGGGVPVGLVRCLELGEELGCKAGHARVEVIGVVAERERGLNDVVQSARAHGSGPSGVGDSGENRRFGPEGNRHCDQRERERDQHSAVVVPPAAVASCMSAPRFVDRKHH